jgi:hypothetical protein
MSARLVQYKSQVERVKTHLPIHALLLALRRPLPLLLLQLLLELRREAKLLLQDGAGDAAPELPALVGQLLLHRGHELGYGEQRVQVNQQDLLRALGKGRVAQGVVYLVHPAALDAGDDVGVGDLLDLGLGVGVGVVGEDDADDAVLRAAEPALLEVLQDHFQPCLGADDVTRVGDGDVQGSCCLALAMV